MSPCKALPCPDLRFPRFVFSIPWRRIGSERVDQPTGCRRHFLDRAVERQLVRA
jgi:hypothetical protein